MPSGQGQKKQEEACVAAGNTPEDSPFHFTEGVYHDLGVVDDQLIFGRLVGGRLDVEENLKVGQGHGGGGELKLHKSPPWPGFPFGVRSSLVFLCAFELCVLLQRYLHSCSQHKGVTHARDTTGAPDVLKRRGDA